MFTFFQKMVTLQDLVHKCLYVCICALLLSSGNLQNICKISINIALEYLIVVIIEQAVKSH